jgi:hypothetical protein
LLKIIKIYPIFYISLLELVLKGVKTGKVKLNIYKEEYKAEKILNK